MFLNTPLGLIECQFNQATLTSIKFLVDKSSERRAPSIINNEIASEIQSYFSNPNHKFNLHMHLTGTAFQIKVWNHLKTITAGKTKTYGELAKELNSSPRAIGQACRTNPIPIIIPCHRVIGAKNLGGFAGNVSGNLIMIKKWLLEHEKNIS